MLRLEVSPILTTAIQPHGFTVQRITNPFINWVNYTHIFSSIAKCSSQNPLAKIVELKLHRKWGYSFFAKHMCMFLFLTRCNKTLFSDNLTFWPHFRSEIMDDDLATCELHRKLVCPNGLPPLSLSDQHWLGLWLQLVISMGWYSPLSKVHPLSHDYTIVAEAWYSSLYHILHFIVNPLHQFGVIHHGLL